MIITRGEVWQSTYGFHREYCHIYECVGCSGGFYCDCDRGEELPTLIIPYYSLWWKNWVQSKINGDY